jgi:hypothetical protein
VTGEIRKARTFKQMDGRIEVPLSFPPYGSLIIVFREPISHTTQGKAERNWPDYKVAQQIESPWDVRFDPVWGGPGNVRFDQLVGWTQRPEPGIRHYSGKAVYTTTFRFPGPKTLSRQYILDLGEVLDIGIARVKLNGKDMGILWTKPFRADITGALQTGENALIVEVTNSWRNRLIADRDLPPEKRYTQTNITVTDKWLAEESGLLGPVQILVTGHEGHR